MSSPPTSAPPVRVEAAEDRGREGAQRDGLDAPALTPGVGDADEEQAGDARRAPPATTQASAETRPSRMPMSAAVSPSSARRASRRPSSEYLKAAKNSAMRTAGDEHRDEPVLADADVAEPDDVTAPRVRHVEDVRADPPGQLGEQDDVDADGEDRQADDRGAAQPVDEQPLDEQRRRRRSGRCRAATASQKPSGSGQPGDRVGAEQQQRAVREADDLAGLEDDRRSRAR